MVLLWPFFGCKTPNLYHAVCLGDLEQVVQQRGGGGGRVCDTGAHNL